MVPVLLIALVPVLAGALLGASPSFTGRWARGAHVVAMLAAVAVVVFELLPAAARELGVLGVALFAAALVAPAVVERAASRLSWPGLLGAELGFAGIALHQVVDGAEVAAAWGHDFGQGVALGIAAHSIPIVAVVVEPFAREQGLRGVATRAAVLLVATTAGVVVGTWGADLHDGAAWLPAVIGGLLLHVLWHAAGER